MKQNSFLHSKDYKYSRILRESLSYARYAYCNLFLDCIFHSFILIIIYRVSQYYYKILSLNLSKFLLETFFGVDYNIGNNIMRIFKWDILYIYKYILYTYIYMLMYMYTYVYRVHPFHRIICTETLIVIIG